MSRLETLLVDLRFRPGMYLPDRRYASLVAFIEGVAQGEGRGPLSDFQAWLAGRTMSPRHWSAQIVDLIGGADPGNLSATQEEAAKTLLIEKLAEFLVGTTLPTNTRPSD